MTFDAGLRFFFTKQIATTSVETHYHYYHLFIIIAIMSTSSSDEQLLLRSAGISEDDDYARLSHYLRCALTSCGVDAIDPDAFAYDPATADSARKVNILMLSTGKQFGLESMSYKTVILDDNRQILTAAEHTKHVTVSDAVEQYNLQLDPLLLGGMIPVQTTHVMVCSLDWVRIFYAEPAKRLKESMSTGGGNRLGGADDDTRASNATASTPLVSDDQVRALFVRNSSMAAMEEDVRDMTSKLQDLIAAKRQAKATSQSFTGEGQSLGGGTTTSNKDGVVWDPQTLTDTPPPLDTASKATSIAVRLLDGKRKIVKLNVKHTVQDLATHLKQAAGGGDVPWMSEKFCLVGGYPPKPLVDANATIADAGLTGAQVTMKKVD